LFCIIFTHECITYFLFKRIGCPPCLNLSESDIQPQLSRRRPGQSRLTTPRSEADQVSILSGTENNITLGTPIGLFVPNENVRPGDYKEMLEIPRPGHADYTYQMKYGTRASSGGGRASARETIGRVAAGAIAEKWLKETYGTSIVTFVDSIGPIKLLKSLYSNPNTGKPWTRDEVDRNGSLVILRDASRTGWKCSSSTITISKDDQAKLDSRDEDIFVEVYNASSADAHIQLICLPN
jgi:chorismate synthase